MRRVALPLLLVSVLSLAGCGGGDDETAPDGGGPPGEISGDADPDDVRVIDAWATTLRRGDTEGAARYFAIPSVAENPPLLVRIRSLDDARRFNRLLPCGARLVHAETHGEFTTATFRLTERPGPGVCGEGVGETAKTTFVIRNGKIAEWRRAGLAPEQGGAPSAPSQST
jgi:hypothetical protein